MKLIHIENFRACLSVSIGLNLVPTNWIALIAGKAAVEAGLYSSRNINAIKCKSKSTSASTSASASASAPASIYSRWYSYWQRDGKRISEPITNLQPNPIKCMKTISPKQFTAHAAYDRYLLNVEYECHVSDTQLNGICSTWRLSNANVNGKYVTHFHN